MLENNSTRLIFAAIAVVIGGVIYGTVNAAYPEATNQIIKKIQAPFTDSSNSDGNVTVSQYAQKTLNVYVPYAIVPGKGILTPTHDKTWLGYDYAYTYSMKDSSFIMDKYNVHNKYGVMYSEYSLNGTNSYTDANRNNVSQLAFMTRQILHHYCKMVNYQMLKCPNLLLMPIMERTHLLILQITQHHFGLQMFLIILADKAALIRISKCLIMDLLIHHPLVVLIRLDRMVI